MFILVYLLALVIIFLLGLLFLYSGYIYPNDADDKLCIYECGFFMFDNRDFYTFNFDFFCVLVVFLLVELEIFFFFFWILSSSCFTFLGFFLMLLLLILMYLSYDYIEHMQFLLI